MTTVQQVPDSATLPGMDEDTIVRELQVEEYPRLKQILPEGFPLPNPKTSRVVIAEDADGAIKGYWFCYIALHIEPLWVAEEKRHDVSVIARMWKKVKEIMLADSWLSAYAIIYDTNIETVGKSATWLGFQKIAGSLYWIMPKLEQSAEPPPVSEA